MTELRLLVTEVWPNPDNVRDPIDPGDVSIRELADSIASIGQLQPITVYLADGRYTVWLGMRRYLALALLAKTDPTVLAWCALVPAPAEALERLDKMSQENLQRKNLNPIEEAKVYLRYTRMDPPLSQAQIAVRLNTHQSRVSTYLRLLDFSLNVQRQIAAGEMPVDAAVKLMGKIRHSAGVARGDYGTKKINSNVPHFNISHPLYAQSRDRCEARPQHVTRDKLGQACGECWEAVIVLNSQRHPDAAPRSNEPAPVTPEQRLASESFRDPREILRRTKCVRCAHPAFGSGEQRCTVTSGGKRTLFEHHEFRMLVTPKEGPS